MVTSNTSLNQAINVENGEVLRDQYKIIRPVSQNAHYGLYEAVDLTSQRRVALKILAAATYEAGRGWESIVQTLEAIREMRRPGLITVFDLYHDHHGAVVVEEWISGARLLELLRSRPLTPTDSLILLTSLAHGLDYLRDHRLPTFAFALSDLLVDAPQAPPGDWLQLPLAAWNAFELKIEPLPLNTRSNPSSSEPFISSFSATLYQMLGGRQTDGASSTGFRPLVSLEEAGNQILRDYVNGTVIPSSCHEILVKVAEAEGITHPQLQASANSSPAPELLFNRLASDVSAPIQSSHRGHDNIDETENLIASKEAEIFELKKALERRLEEKRLAELKSTLEQRFSELEQERARFKDQVAAERDRLTEEEDRLQHESDRLETEKARQDELSSRLENLREEFRHEKSQASKEIDDRQAALDQHHQELGARLQELIDRESSIKSQQEAIQQQEAVLESQSAVLLEQQQQRESELAQNAAEVDKDRQGIERARQRLQDEQAILKEQRHHVAEESSKLASLDRELADRNATLSKREATIQDERRQVEISQKQLAEQKRAFESESEALELNLTNKERELDSLRKVEDRSAAQQAEMVDLQGSKRELEIQRADLLNRRQELEDQTERQSLRLDELVRSHEKDIAIQRNELKAERSRYECLLGQLGEREDEVQEQALKQQQALKQLDDAHLKLGEREKESEKLRSELQRLETEQHRQQNEREEFQQRIAGLQSKIDQLEEDRNTTAKEREEQRHAISKVAKDRAHFEQQLKAEFEKREQLLEQQKAAAERQLQQSEKRVQTLRDQEQEIRNRELLIRQREAKANQLEQLVDSERVARESETKRRRAAEKRSKTLWTKTALAATVAALVLGFVAWAWLHFGGGRGMVREKQLVQQLEQQATEGNPLAMLNLARVFVEDPVNQGNDYTVSTGFAKQLRQLLDGAIEDLLTDQVGDLTGYNSMLEQVSSDPSLESPRGFIERLHERVHLSKGRDLKRRLNQLASRQKIDLAQNPYAKAAAVVRYLESSAERSDGEEFSGVFRDAIDALSKFDEAETTLSRQHLGDVDLNNAPDPAPMLGLLFQVLDHQQAASNRMTTEEIQTAIKLLAKTLEAENGIAKQVNNEPNQDHDTIFRMLNFLSRQLRDSYQATQLHALDTQTRSSIESYMAPVIDRHSTGISRFSRQSRSKLFEFLSLIAETTVDQRLLMALLQDHKIPIPSAMWRGLDYYDQEKDLAALEKLAVYMTICDPSTVPHEREIEEWESFCLSVKARAYRYLGKIQMEKGRKMKGDERLDLFRQAEQELIHGLRLRSGRSTDILSMLNACVQLLGILNQPVHPDCVKEIRSLSTAAYASLPRIDRDHFVDQLDEAELAELEWLVQSPEHSNESWARYKS